MFVDVGHAFNEKLGEHPVTPIDGLALRPFSVHVHKNKKKRVWGVQPVF